MDPWNPIIAYSDHINFDYQKNEGKQKHKYLFWKNIFCSTYYQVVNNIIIIYARYSFHRAMIFCAICTIHQICGKLFHLLFIAAIWTKHT